MQPNSIFKRKKALNSIFSTEICQSLMKYTCLQENNITQRRRRVCSNMKDKHYVETVKVPMERKIV